MWFAEFAEALKIRTMQVVAVYQAPPNVTVIWTPEEDENDLDPETPLGTSLLWRDKDGILRQVGETAWIEGLDWGDLERSLHERFGPPPGWSDPGGAIP
jgi:hypothetical protein